tara:strand:- start:5380 stop:5586 length:207 start_codon:yes stop_codon:yes gene_type:complete
MMNIKKSGGCGCGGKKEKGCGCGGGKKGEKKVKSMSETPNPEPEFAEEETEHAVLGSMDISPEGTLFH